MKIAVINFSGNVGKTTIARHLLMPRIPGAELIAIESINADEGHQGQSLRGRQFGELQEYMQTVDSVVVDIGASNVEDLMALMRRYQGSHEDFDCFVIPTVAAIKQQQDTMATLAELARSGIPRLALEGGLQHARRWRRGRPRLRAVAGLCRAAPGGLHLDALPPRRQRDLRPGQGHGSGHRSGGAGRDTTDYKSLIVKADNVAQKLALAQALATRRLACGVVPELDACFAALELVP